MLHTKETFDNTGDAIAFLDDLTANTDSPQIKQIVDQIRFRPALMPEAPRLIETASHLVSRLHTPQISYRQNTAAGLAFIKQALSTFRENNKFIYTDDGSDASQDAANQIERETLNYGVARSRMRKCLLEIDIQIARLSIFSQANDGLVDEATYSAAVHKIREAYLEAFNMAHVAPRSEEAHYFMSLGEFLVAHFYEVAVVIYPCIYTLHAKNATTLQ